MFIVFGFVMDGDMVQVLSWCLDVQGEVDLVEEVVCIVLLIKLEGKLLLCVQDGVFKLILILMQVCISIGCCMVVVFGYNECIIYSFID